MEAGSGEAATAVAGAGYQASSGSGNSMSNKPPIVPKTYKKKTTKGEVFKVTIMEDTRPEKKSKVRVVFFFLTIFFLFFFKMPYR